jgi:SPASM domain peptide maturase of grasp-with-spasm system
MIVKKFEDCQFIDGYKRSIIIDLTRHCFETIPKSLSEFITKFNNYDIKQIHENSHYDQKIIKEYIDFLLCNEYCFTIEDTFKDFFPPLKLDWDTPFLITNSIIEIGIDCNSNKIKSILTWVKCLDIELRIKEGTPSSVIQELLNELENSIVNSISLVFSFCQFDSIVSLKLHNYVKINSLLCYSCNSSSHSMRSMKKNNPMITFSDKGLEYLLKVASPESFRVNIKMFSESQKHHTYFNRKLYIGSEGEIKNTPESLEEFGRVQNIKELKKIITKPEFQKYWLIDKEQCDVCKNCEFRHICIDNRLPYQRKDGSWYHKEECNYNPYICKWKEENGYLTLKECGVITNEYNYSRDDEKIAAMNEKLWAK